MRNKTLKLIELDAENSDKHNVLRIEFGYSLVDIIGTTAMRNAVDIICIALHVREKWTKHLMAKSTQRSPRYWEKAVSCF